jgi:hypothetical protein
MMRHGLQRSRPLKQSFDRGWAAQSKRNVNVSVFDQMTDDEQNAMLAALAALKAQDVGPLG